VSGLDVQNSQSRKPTVEKIKHFIVDPALSNGKENVVYSNHSNNIISGMQGRCLGTWNDQTKTYDQILQPRCNHMYKNNLKSVKDELINTILTLAGNKKYDKIVSKEQFMKMVPAHKKRLYDKIWDELIVHPVTSADALVKVFTKAEKKLKKDEEGIPRMIYPRHTRFVVALAKYLKQLEEPIYHGINEMFMKRGCTGDVVMKNKNHQEIGELIKSKWRRFKDPVFVGFDMSHFDKHVSKPALQFEHSIYKGLIDSDEMNKLLHWQVDNKFFAVSSDNKIIRAKRSGGRMSGDINTSLGNVLIVTLLTLNFCDRNLKGVPYDVINAGDDSGIIIDRCNLGKLGVLENYFNNFGFLMKIEEHVSVLEQIVFCQTQPVWNGSNYVMVRQIDTSMMKDSACLLELNNKQKYLSWKHEVATAGKILTQGLPILQQYYEFMDPGKYHDKQISYHYVTSGMHQMTKGIVYNGFVKPTIATRISFYLAFGIEPHYQILLENHLNNKNKTPYKFSTYPLSVFDTIKL